jgi:hypothetical protein
VIESSSTLSLHVTNGQEKNGGCWSFGPQLRRQRRTSAGKSTEARPWILSGQSPTTTVDRGVLASANSSIGGGFARPANRGTRRGARWSGTGSTRRGREIYRETRAEEASSGLHGHQWRRLPERNQGEGRKRASVQCLHYARTRSEETA